MWTSAENTALRFAAPSAARTPLAPTAACQPATLAISRHQGAGARVSVRGVGRGCEGRERFRHDLIGTAWWCLQMWMSAGTGLSAAPMQCARICPAPSSASVTKATRGHGTAVTAWVRDQKGSRLAQPYPSLLSGRKRRSRVAESVLGT